MTDNPICVRGIFFFWKANLATSLPRFWCQGGYRGECRNPAIDAVDVSGRTCRAITGASILKIPTKKLPLTQSNNTILKMWFIYFLPVALCRIKLCSCQFVSHFCYPQPTNFRFVVWLLGFLTIACLLLELSIIHFNTALIDGFTITSITSTTAPSQQYP